MANVVEIAFLQEAPASPGTRALLSGSIYGTDLGSPGKYLRLIAEEPPQTSLEYSVLVPQIKVLPVEPMTHHLLSGSIYGVDLSGAGLYRIWTISGIDHTRGYWRWVRIDGTSTWIWSLLDDTVIAGFRHTGIAERLWTMDETQTGELPITGRGTRRWSGTELTFPEAFRVNGVGTRAWFRSGDSFRITGTCTRKWIMAIGIADECLTADGETESGEPQVKNYVF